MASSGNFMTLNPLKYKASSYTTSDISHGNLRIDEKTGNAAQFNVGFVLGDGKFYWELYIADRGGSSQAGVCVGHADTNNYTSGGAIIGNTFESQKLLATSSSGNSSVSSYGADFVATDIIGVAMDFTNSTMEFFKNNSSQGSFSFSGANDGTTYYPYVYCNHGLLYMNTGQDSSFIGQKTSGSANATDDNGFGNFYYAPPSGFLAVCSANLPTSDDIDPAQTNNNIGEKQCATLLYTGTGSSNAVTGLGFKPDLVIIKNRTGTQGTKVTDSSRGVTKVLQTAQANGEETDSNGLTAFGTDGFTVGSDAGYNGSTNNIVAHCWRANGGTTASNSDGDITSTVQANTKAGFSIVEFTGINSATTATVGHGLGKAPTFIIHKSLNASAWHLVRGVPGMPVSYVRDLNPNGSPTDVSGNGGALVAPTNTVFNINNTTGIGGGGYTYVAYCWAPIEGYSKFGTYTGNGNADGPFVYTGFRPQIVLFMGYNYGTENFIFDNKRNTSNVVTTYVRWGRSSAEGSHTHCDFLSNGFKIRNSGGDYNGSGTLIIYAAWGDVPFKYNNTF